MFLLTIVFGTSPVPWGFLFKEEEKAQQAFDHVVLCKQTPDSRIGIEDDFGQKASLDTDKIQGFMLEDMEKSKLANIERGLHQARTQAKAQQQAQQDPVLRAAQLGAASPAVLSPMGMRLNG